MTVQCQNFACLFNCTPAGRTKDSDTITEFNNVFIDERVGA